MTREVPLGVEQMRAVICGERARSGYCVVGGGGLG